MFPPRPPAAELVEADDAAEAEAELVAETTDERDMIPMEETVSGL